MYAPIDTADPQAVQAEVCAIYGRLFRDGESAAVNRAFDWALGCFSGEYPGYQSIDARYHDLEHTLQGTLCLARLFEGRERSGILPRMSREVFDLSLVAILFHDMGYLKEEGDDDGTGAKYTLIHVDRSVEFVGRFLREKGFGSGEILSVQQMIRCTGVNVVLGDIPFQNDLVRLAGYALGTADLVGQMAASDYPDKLPVLFEEFVEAANHNGGWTAQFGPFENAIHLMSQSNDFFAHYVKPKIDGDLGGLHRYLADPSDPSRNEYLDSIDRNLARVREIVAAGRA